MHRYLPALLIVLGMAEPSWAYIAAMSTLGKVSTDASHIAVLEVDKVSREKQVVIFKKVADLKGKGSPDVAKHKLTDGFHPRQAIAVLRETLKATDPWARQQAARFLGKLGPSAKDAADDLAALLEDKDEGVRKAAAEALKSVRGK